MILVVDDNEIDNLKIRRILLKDSVGVLSLEEAREKIKNKHYDCIIVDYFLGDAKTAIDLIEEFPKENFLVITGQGDELIAVECIKKGAADYLPKDRIDLLKDKVQECIEKYEQRLQSMESIGLINHQIKQKLEAYII